jgi:hypothetical protein
MLTNRNIRIHPGTQLCIDCAGPKLWPNKAGRPKLRCVDCDLKIKRERYRKKYYRKTGRECVSGIGTQSKCLGCSTDIVKTRADHTFCDKCLQSRLNAYNRQTRETARRSAGVPLRRGVEERCTLCNTKFVRNTTNGKFCRPCGKARIARWHKHKRKTSPSFALNARVTDAIGKSLRGRKAGRHWESLVGYTLTELMRHLERQFVSGMSWDNRSNWEIDHRVPLSSFKFDAAEDEGFRAAWALTNLQPLWSQDNQMKRDKRIYLI